MKTRVRLVAVHTEQRIIETEDEDRHSAVLDALGQIPAGFTVASLEVTPDDSDLSDDPRASSAIATRTSTTGSTTGSAGCRSSG